MKRISPTGDLAFKKVLASENNKDILAGLITDFFKFEVIPEEMVIENPYNIEVFSNVVDGVEIPILRQTLTDITASLRTANFISEMQVKKDRSFDKRALYYAFERYCHNYDDKEYVRFGPNGRPDRFSSLRPIYSLNLLGEPLFESDVALRFFEMYDIANNEAYIEELIKVGFFELSKPTYQLSANQQHWHDYFTTGEVGPDAPAYLQKASRIIEFVNLSEEERRVATKLEKARAIYDAGLVSAFHDGKDEGRDEGRIEGRNEGRVEGEARKSLEIAKRLIKWEMSLEDIAETTGIDTSALQKLKAEIEHEQD